MREAIRDTVAEHAAQLPERDPTHPLLAPPRDRIDFTGGWSVRLREGGFHSNHVHPMGWISSALYVVLPEDLGREEAGYLTIGDANAPTFKVDVPQGVLAVRFALSLPSLAPFQTAASAVIGDRVPETEFV